VGSNAVKMILAREKSRLYQRRNKFQRSLRTVCVIDFEIKMMNTDAFKVLKGCNWELFIGLHCDPAEERHPLTLSFSPITITSNLDLSSLLRYLIGQNLVHMIQEIEFVLFILHQRLYPITVI
jgi:hypothetical protein